MKSIKDLEKEIEDLERGFPCGMSMDELKATLTQTNEIIKLIEEINSMRVWNGNDGLKELLTKIKGDGE